LVEGFRQNDDISVPVVPFQSMNTNVKASQKCA
jgi:hypothetical protein